MAANPSTEQIDRIAILVENQVVLQSELDKRMEQLHGLLSATQLSKEQVEQQVKKQAIDQLVWDKVIQSLLSQANLPAIPDALIDQQLTLQAAAYDLDLASWLQRMAAQGISELQIRTMLKQQIQLQQLLRFLLQDRIHISEEERAAAKKQILASQQTQSLVQLRHLFLPIKDEADPKELVTVRNEIEKLYKAIQKGANFHQLAIAYSAGEESIDGGLMPWKRIGELPSMFAEKVLQKPAKTLIAPFQTGAGFHILFIEGRKQQQQHVVDEYHLRHILLQVQEKGASRASVQQTLQKVERSIRNRQQTFEAAAIDLSEDPSSAKQGGDLGWNVLDSFAPEFAEAAKNLKIGEMTSPVETVFGWHLIKLVNKRNRDVSDALLQQEAELMLISKKLEEMKELWKKEKLAEVYVEIVDPIVLDEVAK